MNSKNPITLNWPGDLDKELIRIDDLSFISYLVNRASHGSDFRVLWDEEIQGNAFLTFPGDSF